MTTKSKLAAPLVLLAVAVGCSDPYDALLTPVPEPREEVLIDFLGGDLVDAAAFDLIAATPVRTDLTSGWDMLFLVSPEDGPSLVPRSSVLDEDSSAGIQIVNRPFALFDEAPGDGYTSDAPTPIQVGDVIAVVSRSNPGVSVRCRYYGKFEILSISGDPARLTINAVVNPNCEERALIEEDED